MMTVMSRVRGAMVWLLLMGSVCFVWAAPEPPAGVLLDRAAVLEAAAAVTADGYPNADYVLVDEHIHTVYQADGTEATWDDEYLKILTEKGRREYDTVTLHYTLPYGTAEVYSLEIIGPDGTARSVALAEQSRVMVDSGQMSANIYNPNSKVLKVSVPDLELGDVLHIVSYRETVKPRVPDTWSGYHVFEYTAPIRRMTLTVDGPAALPLINRALRDPVPGTVTFSQSEDGDRVRYRWEVRDVPRMYREPRMPALHTVVQRLLLSTIPDWETLSRWYWNLSKPRLDTESPLMEPKVRELTADATSRADKIAKLFQFVSQHIRYMGITTETEAPGYEPHDVKVTFENRYGVCRDKAALLVAMLRKADIPAYPVLIHVGPRKDEAVPQPYFNHAIVAAEAGAGDYVLMDPTDENTRQLLPAYLNHMSYLVAHPEGRGLLTSPVEPATNNLMVIQSEGALDASGTLEMRSVLSFEGINDNAYRGHLARLKPEERRRFFEGQLKRMLAGARLKALELFPSDLRNTDEALRAHLAYSVPNYRMEGESRTLLTPPWLGGAFGYANFLLGNTGLDERKYPLVTRLTAGVRETFRFTAAEADTVLPDQRQAVMEGVIFRQSLKGDSGVVAGEAEFLLDAVEFAPPAYLDLKQWLKDGEHARRVRMVVEAADSTGHDVIVERDDVMIELTDASHWTARETVRKRVLTYAGKKEHSELKLTFNPAWESVRVVEAVVTGPDGTEQRVVAEEQNLMDAGWVASAPRYPPQKTLVVSLPGVEMGSIIAYTVERTAAGVPFFSTLRVFGGDNPIEAMSLKIVSPPGVALVAREYNGLAPGVLTTEDNGRTVHRWELRDLPAIKPEDSLPPLWSFLPSVMVSAGNWVDYGQTLEARLMEVAGERSAVSKLAREVTAGLSDPVMRLRALRDAAVRRVRLAGPGLASLPWSSITTPDRTLAEGYGNTTDRALVLWAMARAAGFETELRAVSSWSPREASLLPPLLDIPQRGLFDKLLVGVRLDKRRVWLNDTDQYAWPGVTHAEGRVSLALDGTVAMLDVAEDMTDQSDVTYRIDVAADGSATITVRQAYYGSAFGSANRQYAQMPPEERRRHFLELVAGLSQAARAEGELETRFGVYPGERSFTVSIDRFAVRNGSYLYFELPAGLGDVLGLRSDTREQPWYRASPADLRIRYDVRLPSTVARVLVTPRALDWVAPGQLGRVRQTARPAAFGPKGPALRVEQSATLEPAIVRPEHYSVLLELQRQLLHPGARTIMVELRD